MRLPAPHNLPAALGRAVEGDPGLVRGPQLNLIADHRGDGDANHAEQADRPEE
jgi:hypothetical protein